VRVLPTARSMTKRARVAAAKSLYVIDRVAQMGLEIWRLPPGLDRAVQFTGVACMA